MCGFVAVVGGGNGQEIAALAALAHRGPDSQGIWFSQDENIWLGHRRLAIVDLSPSGNQPMANENGQLQLVCNGEIYNAPSLRQRLIDLGHTFCSKSDNEVILHAYEAWGEACLDHLEGMFAFVLWDRQKRLLLAARDRLGIKPLYWTTTPEGGLLLASELTAILPLLHTPPKPNPEALAYVMTLSYVPSPQTIWCHISKLEPGHRLLWSPPHGLRLHRYWEPPRDLDQSAHPQEFANRFESVLTDHLLADVPVGLFLSGGLDSSSVAVGLNQLEAHLEAFTVGFPQSPRNEAPLAAQIAAHLGLKHHLIEMTNKDLPALMDLIAKQVDEPDGHSAHMPMYLICQAAAKKFKVVLAGDGGDELFGGYTWYQGLATPLPGHALWLRKGWGSLVPAAFSFPTRQAAAHFARSSLLHRHAWRLFPRFLPEEVTALLAPMGLEFDDEKMLEPLARHFEPKLPLPRALQRIDLMTFCCDHILTKVDRTSMAHSLEVRVPFLDRRLVEWAFALPSDSHAQIASKPLLRNYLKNRVPEQVFEHQKQGFSTRVKEDFNWDHALGRVQQGCWLREGYWSNQFIKKITQPGIPDRQGRIAVLLALTNWGEAWLHR
ncbi:MAG: asparagine synthase (glutamine-hydrolyzing) [Magnetococcus sp. DMHC-6]